MVTTLNMIRIEVRKIYHLTGKVTYGVWFKEYTTRFMGLDIDIKPQNGGLEALEEIVDLLHSKGIKNAYIPTYSGNKGFHIDIFFDSYISKKYADRIYNDILENTGYSKTEVELRGGKENRSGYKLPLGVHQKTLRRCDLVKVREPKKHKSREIKNYKHIYKRLKEIKPLSLGDVKELVDIDDKEENNSDTGPEEPEDTKDAEDESQEKPVNPTNQQQADTVMQESNKEQDEVKDEVKDEVNFE